MVTRTVLPVLTGMSHQPAAVLDVEHRLFEDRRRAEGYNGDSCPQSDPKELPTASAIRRVEVWGSLAKGALAVPDRLRLDAL